MKSTKKNVLRQQPECAAWTAIDTIAGKWKMCILHYLCLAPRRHGELLRLAEGITQKMLTQQLRELEASGIVIRTSYPEVPPRVEYRLTPRGEELVPVFQALHQWGQRLLADANITPRYPSNGYPWEADHGAEVAKAPSNLAQAARALGVRQVPD